MSSKVVIGVMLTVLISAGLAPKMVGSSIEASTVSSFLDLLPPESRSQFDVSDERFENGWFDSSGSMIIEITPLGSETLQIELAYDILHGPIIFSDDGLKLGLAYVQWHPTFTNTEMQALLDSAPIDLPQLDINMLIGFDESLALDLSLAPFNYSDSGTEVNFEGLQASFVANADNSGEFLLSVGQLQASDANSGFSVTLSGVEVSSSTEKLSDLLAPSAATFIIPSISSAAPYPFTVNDLSASSKVQPSSAGPDQTDIYQSFEVASIESDFPLASASWVSEMNEVHNDLFSRYYTLLTDLQAQASGDPGALNAQAAQLGNEAALLFLQNGLVLNNTIKANAYDGDHSIDINIDWDGLPQLTDFTELNVREALAALNLSLNVDLDDAAISISPAAAFIDPYVQQGYLQLQNGRIQITASLQNGELQVNGDVMSLDQFF